MTEICQWAFYFHDGHTFFPFSLFLSLINIIEIMPETPKFDVDMSEEEEEEEVYEVEKLMAHRRSLTNKVLLSFTFL